MSSKAASSSMFDLTVCLQQKGSQQNLACIQASGCARKQCWIQYSEVDTVTFLSETHDHEWVQLVIVSAMVAAKTQRRQDKMIPTSMRRGWKIPAGS